MVLYKQRNGPVLVVGEQNPSCSVLAPGMCLWFPPNPLNTDVKTAGDISRQDSSGSQHYLIILDLKEQAQLEE